MGMNKSMERELESMGTTDKGSEPGSGFGPSSESRNLEPSVPLTLLDKIIALDMACLRALASLSLPKFVSLPLVLLVRIGDGWIWFFIAFYLWKSLPLMQLQSAIFHGLVAIAISLAIYWPIKLLVTSESTVA